MLSYDQIKMALKQNGFPFVKLEFEANVRGEPCEYCNEGHQTCDDCDGTGEVDIINRHGEVITRDTCPTCDGEGNGECVECGGHWQGEIDLDLFESNFRNNLPAGFATTYLNAYVDGSVNTEVTMTFSIDKLHLVEDVIRAFVKTSEDMGTWDTENAGFHISLLPTGDYPVENRLHPVKIKNFQKSMDKIVDAMFFLSTGDGKTTRKLQFREPRVSPLDKYSAIYTHDETCIEYRLFDPCYLKPERFHLYMNTIVRTLKFYSKKHVLANSFSRNDLKLYSSGYVDIDKLATDKGWRDLLFKKLVYLYSDKDRLQKLEQYSKSRPISDKTLLAQIA